MKKKIIVYTVLSLVGASVLGVSIASAKGFGGLNMGWGFGMGGKNLTAEEIASNAQTMFEKMSQILGVSVAEIKDAWAQGKNLKDLMSEKNISQDQVNQKMKELQLQQYKDQLQTLVGKGVITQAQADQRLQAMQNKTENFKGGKRGMGCNWMF